MRDVWESKYPIREILKQDFHKNVFLKKLLEIPDCPNKIFWRGNFKSESDLAQLKFLVVVGSRNLSTYGKDVIKFLIEGLRGSPVCIISGLALGADSEAHKNAIKNNLWTIVVPGSGIKENVLYPRSNTKLGKEILEHSGLFLNEFEPDFPASFDN
jgi:DNA processing protein